MNVFINREGSVEGPFDIDDLKKLVNSGELTGAETVCPEGEDIWIPLSAAFSRRQAAPGAPVPPPSSPTGANKKRSGCRKGCVSLLVVGAMLCLILVITVNQIVWHSSIPYKVVAHLISDSNPNIEIEGISGSISEGVSIQHFSYTDADGNTTFLEGAGFHHNPLKEIFTKKRFILHNVEVKRGHFFVDTFIRTDTTEKSAGGESVKTDDSPVGSGNGLDLFEIKNIAIHDVVVEARDTHKTLELNLLHLNGFKVEKGQLDMGELMIKSNVLDLEIPPAMAIVKNGQVEKLTLHFKGHLKPDLIEALAQGIRLNGDFNIVDGKLNQGTLTACDGALKAFMREKTDDFVTLRMTATDWRMHHYAPILMLDHVTGTLTAETTSGERFPGTSPATKAAHPGKGKAACRLTVSDLSFKLGTAQFTGDPLNVVQTPNQKEPVVLVSRAVKGDISYELTATVTPDEASDSAICELSLTSTPATSRRDSLATLLFDQEYASLSTENKKRVDWHEQAFLTPLFAPDSDKNKQDKSHSKGDQ